MGRLPAFSELKFGDHCCLLHDTVEQQVAVSVLFLQAGLKRNERCVCVLDPEKMALVRKALIEAQIDVEWYERNRTIVLSSARDFLNHGHFHAGKMIQFLQAAIDESRVLNFEGLRATGDMTWQAGNSEYDGFIEYEATLDRFFEGKPIIGLCQYNRAAFQPEVLQNAFRTHRSVVIDTQFCPQNLFYQSPDILMVKDEAVLETKRAEWMRVQVQRLATAEAERDELDRRKDEFLMTLSHELRTPLTPILGWARIIQSRDYDKATVIRGIDVIERSAKAEAALVNDMLELSRIVAGKLKLEVTDVNLQSVVEAAIEVVLPEAAAKSIDIRRAIESSVPFIPGDQNRLQQVFWNLLKNAIKFTPAGGNVDISVATEESWVKIIVKDNGEGIDARYLPRVFDRFSMQDASTTRRHGGLGIGLSIVRHLVQLHGGQVVAESGGVGCGATFTVFLPHRKSSQIASSTQNLPSRCINKALRLKGARVLVVDDNADTLDYISQALQEAGATVTCAHSVSSAMDVILQFKPSILVSDIGMPDEDGLSLIRRLRTGGHSLPAVALSAHAKAEDCQRSIAAGFERHVTKPVDPYELIEVVAEVGKSTTIDRQDNTESN